MNFSDWGELGEAGGRESEEKVLVVIQAAPFRKHIPTPGKNQPSAKEAWKRTVAFIARGTAECLETPCGCVRTPASSMRENSEHVAGLQERWVMPFAGKWPEVETCVYQNKPDLQEKNQGSEKWLSG